jgi:hypothetical protein
MSLETLRQDCEDTLREVGAACAPKRFDDPIAALEAGRAPRMDAAITSAVAAWGEAKTVATGFLKSAKDMTDVILDEIRQEGPAPTFAADPNLEVMYATALENLRNAATANLARAEAEAERLLRSADHDFVLVLALDQRDFKIANMRAHMKRKRGLATMGTSELTRAGGDVGGDVLHGVFYGRPHNAYAEVNFNADALEQLDGDIDDLCAQLTPRSKVIVWGHGSPGSSTVGSDERTLDANGAGRPVSIAIDALARKLGEAIARNAQHPFRDHTTPLQIVFRTCSGGAIDVAAVSRVASTGELVDRSRNVIDARSAMAGRLLVGLHATGVFARVKAYSTTIATGSNLGFVAAPQTISALGLTGLHEERRAGLQQKRHATDFVALATNGTAGIATYWYPQGAATRTPTAVTFNGQPPAGGAWGKAYETKDHALEDYDTSGRAGRLPGTKRIFEWNAQGAVHCTDAKTSANVDFIFEANRDRLIAFLYLEAQALPSTTQPSVAAKRFAYFLGLRTKLEQATDTAALAQALTEMAQAPPPGSDVTWVGYEHSQVAEQLRAHAAALRAAPTALVQLSTSAVGKDAQSNLGAMLHAHRAALQAIDVDARIAEAIASLRTLRSGRVSPAAVDAAVQGLEAQRAGFAARKQAALAKLDAIETKVDDLGDQARAFSAAKQQLRDDMNVFHRSRAKRSSVSARSPAEEARVARARDALFTDRGAALARTYDTIAVDRAAALKAMDDTVLALEQELEVAIESAENGVFGQEHDLIVVLALDVGDAELAGFRERALRSRNAIALEEFELQVLREAKAVGGGKAAVAKLHGGSKASYVEVSLTYDGAHGANKRLANLFGRLTARSKLVIVSHAQGHRLNFGGARGAKRGWDLVDFGQTLGEAIKLGNPAHPFGDELSPLAITLHVSGAGAIDLLAPRLQAAGGTLVVAAPPAPAAGNAGNAANAANAANPPPGPADPLATSPAVILLRELKRAGVYARIRARTTSVYEANEDGDVVQASLTGAVAARGRALAVKANLSNWNGDRVRYVTSDPARTGADHTDRGSEAAPTLEMSAISSKTTGVRHGYKRVFFIDSNDQLHVRDVAVPNQDVDLLFEANRERAIRFVLGAAYRVASGVHKKGGKSERKFDALVAEASKLEVAMNSAELAVVARQVAGSRAATTHRSALGFGTTRTARTLTLLADRLARNPVELLPLPNLESETLGL